MTQVPSLTTERLVLRPPILADWGAFATLMASHRANFMGGPFSRSDAWGIFCHGIALWHLTGLGALTVTEKGSDGWIGQVEINQGPRFPEPELGWQIAEDAEGKGYAFEAAKALRDWTFENSALTTLVSYIDPQNARSIRLAERLGATLDIEAQPQDAGDLVYRHAQTIR